MVEHYMLDIIIFLYYFMTGGKEYVEEYAENLLGHMTYIENAQQIVQ